MFYEKSLEDDLRFGDIIKDVFTVDFDCSLKNRHNKLDISIKKESYCVVLTPCCSISKVGLIITPVIDIDPIIIRSDYCRKDLTNANRRMWPKQAVSKIAWDTMEKSNPREIERREQEGFQFAFLHNFIYEGVEDFSEKIFQSKYHDDFQTNYKMIDFSLSKKVFPEVRMDNYPKEIKCYQLSVQTRKELRDKLKNFYGRATKEDDLILDK